MKKFRKIVSNSIGKETARAELAAALAAYTGPITRCPPGGKTQRRRSPPKPSSPQVAQARTAPTNSAGTSKERLAELMDQRMESDRRSRACGRRTGRGPRGGACRPCRLRGYLPCPGIEEAHEGSGGTRLPRSVPRSRDRGTAAAQRNADRGALEAGAQRHRPAGTLTMAAAACRRGVDNGARVSTRAAARP